MIRLYLIFAAGLALVYCTPANGPPGPDASDASITWVDVEDGAVIKVDPVAACAKLVAFGCSLGSEHDCAAAISRAPFMRHTTVADIACVQERATTPADAKHCDRSGYLGCPAF